MNQPLFGVTILDLPRASIGGVAVGRVPATAIC